METLRLLEDLRAGRDEKAAKGKLYAILREGLLKRIDRKIPQVLKSRLDAEDVLHDAFLRAMSVIGQFASNDEKAFTAWVYKIAKNLIYDAVGRQSVLIPHFTGSEDPKGLHESQVVARDGRATAIFRQEEWCKWALDQLDPRDREVIQLRDLQSRSYEEIAQAWGATPAAVRKTHSRALQKVKEIAEREAERKPPA